MWHLLRRSVYQSMERYTKLELLKGKTQYKAEGFGMQVRLAYSEQLAFCLHISMVYGVQVASCLRQGSIMHRATYSMLHGLQSHEQQSRMQQLGHKTVRPLV